jgi:quercetin dioxygenase-like cupin family protein
VELLPGQSTRLHRHTHDYVFVVLGPSQLYDQTEGKPAVTVRFAEGEARYVRGGFTHRDRNSGETPFRCVAIEILKQGGDSPLPPAERSLDIGHGHTEDVIVDNAQVRVTEVQIAPGAQTDEGSFPGPWVLVAVTPLELEQVQSGRERPLRVEKGGFEWIPSGPASKMVNRGRGNARYVAVAFR